MALHPKEHIGASYCCDPMPMATHCASRSPHFTHGGAERSDASCTGCFGRQRHALKAGGERGLKGVGREGGGKERVEEEEVVGCCSGYVL